MDGVVKKYVDYVILLYYSMIIPASSCTTLENDVISVKLLRT